MMMTTGTWMIGLLSLFVITQTTVAVPGDNLYLYLLNGRGSCSKPCYNGGVCEYSSSGSTYSNIRQTCRCPEPYTGEFCQDFKRQTECNPPCVPGQGECVLLENSRVSSHLADKAYCNCSTTQTGYYIGEQCQVHFKSKCTPPCLNGGSCIDDMCVCMYGDDGYYWGNQCQYYYVIECPPCLNGGTCQKGGECVCTRNATGHFSGEDCGTYVEDNCSPSCLNGATCSGTTCICPGDSSGYYYGRACENYVVVPEPCGCVHGKCRYGTCECFQNSTSKYTGSKCDVFVNRYAPCQPGCENGGVCDYGVCQCKSNSTHSVRGSRCENAAYECPNPCQNGGTCSDGYCLCPLRYSGDRCEIYLSECPCGNGGECGETECLCRGNVTHTANGDRCQYITKKETCYPTPLNGGICAFDQQLCAYDDIGYFYGEQCLQYGYNRCEEQCSDVQVCIGNECKCPYSTKDRYYYSGPICHFKLYV